jgi:uncharacterized membrane protein YeaQ/YmgE (transglycosylase-associated protein family)
MQTPSPEPTLNWFQKHRLWAWTAAGIVGSVLLLLIGSQLAKWWGQDVDWYAGFGQWLGAIGSIIAAIVALYIATSDRRAAAELRQAEQEEREDDLKREAGLVRVLAKPLSFYTIGYPETFCGVSVSNRRVAPIFDLEVSSFIAHGSEVVKPELYRTVIYPKGERERTIRFMEELQFVRLVTDQTIALTIKGHIDAPAEYAAVRYTDSKGLRWQVDTKGDVERIHERFIPPPPRERNTAAPAPSDPNAAAPTPPEPNDNAPTVE